MNPEKKLTLSKITLNRPQQKIGLPPKITLNKQLDSRPQSSKIDIQSVNINWLVDNIQQENKLEWIQKCYVFFKDWTQNTECNDQCKEQILKQSIQLIDFNDLQVRLYAIKAALFGFTTLNLLDLLFQKQAKPLLRRPKSGSKIQEQLPSLLYQPQQILAILQKTAQLSNENVFLNLINDNSLSFVLFRILKLFTQLPKDQTTTSQQLPYLNLIFIIIKNIANNQKEAQKLLQPTYIQLIDNYLHSFPYDQTYEKDLLNLYTTITATLRNLANENNSVEMYLQNGIIKKLVISMVNYSNNYELILNTLRIMSKMSLSKECCEYFLQSTEAMQNISSFFKTYQTNIYIIIRASFLLANMTTYFEGIRQLIYYKFNQFGDILKCFDYYWTKEINPQQLNQIDQFSQSRAAWDFQILQSEKDIDALIRIIRLIANILTIEQIGLDILKNYSNEYRILISKLLKLLQKNTIITKQQEIISCTLSCLSNLTFYEKQTFLNDFEYKNIKYELITTLGHFIIQNEDQEICCDGLRVLSNLSRQKDLIKQIMKSRISEGVIVLLDSNSREVVYYCLGVILNLLQDQDFKKKENINIIDYITQVLNDCTTNENDIANLGLKCLILLLDSNLNQEYANKIETAVQTFGNVCDQVLKVKENNELSNTRQLINQIINNIPEEGYPCMQPNCGRKFKSQMELQIHINRRHKL
ncbi:unnamed protein product [Paramecium primaurelia]|uniref:C2H2-type domain-containing protein n=1 Tax=Paramecium primaurelia TaxID=5886 RepID=A0A8S1NCT9_PARPR|nr:unnamed protein product [Paramecium primaurelia]